MRTGRTLPVFIAVFIVLAAMHVTAGTVYAAGVSCAPLVINEGFTHDGVLEKDGEAGYMDNENSQCCFYADPDREGSLPSDGIIKTNDGRYYRLGKYNQNNFVKLDNKTAVTLSFDEASRIESSALSFLVTGCDSGGTVTAKVHFADTEDTVTREIAVPDWDISIGGPAVYHCGRYSQKDNEYEETAKYGLYERTISIPDELQGHKVESVELSLTSWTDGRCTVCVFAVTATPVADTRCVIYDANGGSLESSSGVVSVPVGSEITLAGAERGDDALEGWYDGDTKAGAAEGSYTVSDNVVLRAKWKTIYIWVLLYGEGSTPHKYYQNDDGKYEHPEMVHYTFKGFSKTQDGELIEESALVPKDTYYAVWEENPFVIIDYGSLPLGPLKLYLTEDCFISGYEGLPKIGTDIISNGKILEGYYSDTEFTKPVDVRSPIPEELFGRTIYAKIGDPFIYVKGIAVTAGNKADVLEDQSVSFDFDTMTFTLKNADITFSDGEVYPDQAAVLVNTDRPITICLEGENRIAAGSAGRYGIFHKGRNASLTVKGVGSLNISADTGIACANPAQLDVQPGAELEVRGATQAIRGIGLTNDTKALGVKIRKSADAAEYEPWDGVSELASEDIKGIRIPDGDPKPEPAPDDGKGEDGADAGPSDSAEAAEKAIMNATSDEGPDGTVFSPLRLRSTKQTKRSVKLRWTKAQGAAGYVIYGNLCGNKYRMEKLASVSGSTGSKTIKQIAGDKLKKGRYYKFIILAIDGNNRVVSTSKVIHVATKGGRAGNHKKVTVRKKAIAKAKKLKKGKSLKLKAKAVKAAGPSVKKHRAVRYESSNPEIASVSSKGVVKGRNKGSCYIYAYAQNGVFKKIKAVVR